MVSRPGLLVLESGVSTYTQFSFLSRPHRNDHIDAKNKQNKTKKTKAITKKRKRKKGYQIRYFSTFLV